jgi:adenylate kinase
VNLILLGPPGSGKGTQGALLAKRLGIPKISTGDLLRAAMKDGTPLGRQARSYYDKGLLVPDEIIMGLIEEVLASDAARRGVIMDGFPRNTAQAEAVGALLAARDARVDHVLNFEVSEDELVKRMLGRAAQEGRSDDTPETIRKRLAVYLEQTAPLVDYYRRQGRVHDIDAAGSVDEIAERIKAAVGA